MSTIEDHPLRYKLANELHAAPFSVDETAVFGGLCGDQAAQRRRQSGTGRLIWSICAPCWTATAHRTRNRGPRTTMGRSASTGSRWEQHTEFVTYTAFTEGYSERAFDPSSFEVFPDDWLSAAPGQRVTSVMLHVLERPPSDDEINAKLKEWFCG